MKAFKITVLAIGLLAFTGCARSCQSWEKETLDNHAHHLRITHFSGGKVVGEWELKSGIVNNSESSDGYYFYTDNGKLIEISGDVRLEYLD